MSRFYYKSRQLLQNQVFIKILGTTNGKEKIGGYLPRKISRPTKFLLAREAVMYAEVSSDKYRYSPLVQGGLELSCVVYVSMPPTVLNENLISRYKHNIMIVDEQNVFAW